MSSLPTTAVADAARVEFDLLCLHCDYNLRSQPTVGACPECGRPVRETLDFPRLARSAPRWITSLLDSVTLLLVAIGVAFVALLNGDGTLGVCLAAAVWGLVWFAIWMLTRPEPGRSERRARLGAWSLRLFATAPFICTFFVSPNSAGNAWLRDVSDDDQYIVLAIMVLLGLASIPATFFYYGHLESAAARLPNRRLVVQAGFCRLVLPVTMLASPIGIFLLGRSPRSVTDLLLRWPIPVLGSPSDAWTFGQTITIHIDWIQPLSLALTLAAFSVLCSFAVLIQFRFAFAAARASSESRRRSNIEHDPLRQRQIA